MKKKYYLIIILLVALCAPVFLNAQVNMTNGMSLSCSDSLYDSNGPNGDYGLSENLTYTIAPFGADSISFYVDSINIGALDTLFIFDGSGTGGTLIAAYTDTSVGQFGFGALTDTITFFFISDFAGVDRGWSIEWQGHALSLSATNSASATNICQGDFVLSTASVSGGSGAYTYQWYYDGLPAGGAVNPTYLTLVANGASIFVTATDSACPNSIDTSNTTVFTVTPTTTSSVSLAATSTSVCGPDSVVFTATPTNGGTTPTYAWTINGTPAGTNSASFVDSNFTNGDVVKVTMASDFNGGCLIDSISADSAAITVSAFVTASVSLSATDTVICSGTAVTFTATPTNGGTPVYTWTVNGTPVGSNSSTFIDSSFANSDVVKVTMASSIATGCLIDSISADSTTMVVTASTTASVALAASNTSICETNPISFTATPTNGGTTPTYAWTINGTPAGTNSASFADSNFTNGDVVKVTMASDFNGGCLVDSISSDSTAITVTAIDTASVVVSATDTNICSGDPVTFTAIPTNGATPVYAWTVNGTPAGSNSSTFIDSSFSNNDVVKVTMASGISTGCLVDSVSADSTTMVVTLNTTASVALAASTTSICETDPINFTATPTNGGTTPTYSWAINGTPAGTNSAAFADSSFSNGDVVTVTMASDFNGGCLVDSISADSVAINVTLIDTASVSVSVTDPSVCNGTSVTFTATPTNGGGAPVYSWTVDGTPVGSNSTTYASSFTTGAYNVKVSMASTINTGCLVDSIIADSLSMNSNQNPSASASKTNSTCNGFDDGTGIGTATGGNIAVDYTYLWNDGGTQANDTAFGLAPGLYQVTITDDSLCFDTAYVSISEPSALDISFFKTDASTFGGNDGSIDALGSGGVPFASGQLGYYHNWNTLQGTGYGSQRKVTYTYGSLASDWYVDTITDLTGCKYYDSVFIDQPFVLLGGEISINGSFSDQICDSTIVGLIAESNPDSGGVGTTRYYTWQRSYNLSNWTNITTPDTLDTSYVYNDTITKNTFIRRRVRDENNNTAFSNIIFLNYIPDVTINVIGLGNNYCSNEDSIIMFGSPPGNNTTTFGYFTNSAYVDSATSAFIPSLAANSLSGVKNYVQYEYFDAFGCYSTLTDSAIVYAPNSGSIAINQNIFTPNDDTAKLTNTFGGGTFNGVGVYQSGGVWQFDPALVPSGSFGDTLDISYSFTNGNNCVSVDTLGVVVNDDNITLTTNFGNPSQFFTCKTDPAGKKMWAKFDLGSLTITDAQWWTSNTAQTLIYWNGTTYNGLFTDSMSYAFNPAFMLPNTAGTLFDTSGSYSNTATPTGITNVTVHFRYKTLSNPNWTSVSRDIELVNLGGVSFAANQNNSNGAPGTSILRYCVDLDTVSLNSTFLNLSPRSTFKNFTTTVGSGFTNNQTSAIINPGLMGSSSLPVDTIYFTHQDSATGCMLRTSKLLWIDSLPTVSISNLDPEYCSNEGSISFSGIGSPGGNIGTFSSTTSGSLNLSQVGGTNNASIIAQASSEGLSQDMTFTYTVSATGCTNSSTINFDIHGLPTPSLSITGGFGNTSICETDNGILTVTGTPSNGDFIYGNGIVANPSVSTPLDTGSADFRPDSAGAGVHGITYFYTDGNNCTDSVTQYITVNALPSASFATAEADYNVCMIPSDILNFTYTGGDIGTSVYTINTDPTSRTSFEPVTNSAINFSTNKVYHQFTETATTCVNYDSLIITVDPFPMVSISSPQLSYCYNSGDILFNGVPAYNGASAKSYFTSATLGFTDSLGLFGNDSTIFSPDAFDVGTHNVTYGYTDPITGCFADSTISILIDTVPVLTIQVKSNPLSPFIHCLGDTVRYELLKDGVVDNSPLSYLSGAGILDSVSTGGILFDPDLAGVDTLPGHVMTYSVTDPAVCNNSEVFNVKVRETADGSFSFNPIYDTICMQDGLSFVLTPVEPGGDFYFHGAYKRGVANATFKLDSCSKKLPSLNDSIYYTSNLTGCSNSTSAFILVNDTPVTAFVQLEEKYCWNDDTIQISVSDPSLGLSYFTSNTSLIGTSPILNSGIASYKFPIDISDVNFHHISYHHTNANGCVGVKNSKDLYPAGVQIKTIPTLNLTLQDTVGNFMNANPYACATNFQVKLTGNATAGFTTNDTTGGYYTSSIYGNLNNLISNTLSGSDSVGRGIYGPTPPVDSIYRDTIYYHFTDQVAYGCSNTISKTITIRALPPAQFTIDPSSNPNPVNICPDEDATTQSYYDLCGAMCKNINHWQVAKLTRTWWINDTTPSYGNLGKFNPQDPRKPEIDDDLSTIYNGWNKITQKMSYVAGAGLPCISEYSDSVYLNTVPVVDIFVDPLYCSNDGNVVFIGSPSSPGISTTPSRFGSADSTGLVPPKYPIPGSYLGTLDTLGDSTFVVNVNLLTPGAPGTKKKFGIYYAYTDITTGCTDSASTDFELKTKPNLSFGINNDYSFCPYDDPANIDIRVNGSFSDTSGGALDILTGIGVDPIGILYPGGSSSFGQYIPRTFICDSNKVGGTLCDSTTHTESIKYYHRDSDGCEDSITSSNYVVKHQPLFKMDLEGLNKDSVCLEEGVFALPISYWDNGLKNFKLITSVSGQNPISGDQNYFSYGTNLQPPADPNGYLSINFLASQDSRSDSAGVSTQIRFVGTYAQTGECYDTLISHIVTHPKPVASYFLEGYCEKYVPVMRGDSSYIDSANFSPSDGLRKYEWRIQDTIVSNTPSYSYFSPGDTLPSYTHAVPLSAFGTHKIGLRVISKKGCRSDWDERQIQFVTSPQADFFWNMSDECEGASVDFMNETGNLLGASYRWFFGDGDTATTKDTSHTYSAPGEYFVTLEVTQGADCQDTMIKTLNVRPNIVVTDDYLEDFETNPATKGWTVVGERYSGDEDIWWYEGDTADYTFRWGTGLRDSSSIQTPTNAFYVNQVDVYDTIWDNTTVPPTIIRIDTLFSYENAISTAVISPCFDLSHMERPMILLDNIYNMESNDGVVLRYTTEMDKPLNNKYAALNDDIRWKNIGEYYKFRNSHYETGINWYNKENIFADPGGQLDTEGKIGWTDTSLFDATDKIPDWIEARHGADPVAGEPYVRFMIGFSSSQDQAREGYIFDNFRIQERKRKVMYEMFNSANTDDDLEKVDDYNDIIAKYSQDVVDMQYHTAFPARDPLNYDNSADPSARSLYYSIGQVPYVRIDGTKYSNFIDSKSFNEANHQPLSLTDPIYHLGMGFDENNNSVSVTVTADNTPTNGPTEIVVHTAVIEKQISAGDLSTTQGTLDPAYSEFRNTLKKMYPTASGTIMTPGGYDGWSETVTHTLSFDKFYNGSEDFKIVAFVQDKNTKEIYQAEWLDTGQTSIGMPEYEDLVFGGVEYALYPNPTNGMTFMNFSTELDNNYEMRIFNEIGVLVRQEVIAGGTKLHAFEMTSMKPGMYFIMLNDGEHEVAIKKLIVNY